MAGLVLPLALGRVPPNALYGFRTPRTLTDDEVWYGVNRPAGWALFFGGLVGALGSLVGLATARSRRFGASVVVCV